MFADAVGESRTFHEPATRLLTLLRLAREVLSVFRLARDAPAVISFGEGVCSEFRLARPNLLVFRLASLAKRDSGRIALANRISSRPGLAKRDSGKRPLAKRDSSKRPLAKRNSSRLQALSWRFREQWPCERTAAAGRAPCVLRRTLPCWKHPPQHTTSARRVQKRKSAAPLLPSLVRFCTRGAESDGGTAAHASRHGRARLSPWPRPTLTA